MTAIRSAVLLWTSAVLLAACGGADGSGGTAALAGLYHVDVERTFAARGSPLEGQDAAARASLAQRLGPDAYALELRATGEFRLRIRAGGTLVVEGTWTSTADGVQLLTTRADGEPVEPTETSVLKLEGSALVSEDGGQRIFLVRT